jgi:hypothetical protein
MPVRDTSPAPNCAMTSSRSRGKARPEGRSARARLARREGRTPRLGKAKRELKQDTAASTASITAATDRAGGEPVRVPCPPQPVLRDKALTRPDGESAPAFFAIAKLPGKPGRKPPAQLCLPVGCLAHVGGFAFLDKGGALRVRKRPGPTRLPRQDPAQAPAFFHPQNLERQAGALVDPQDPVILTRPDPHVDFAYPDRGPVRRLGRVLGQGRNGQNQQGAMAI